MGCLITFDNSIVTGVLDGDPATNGIFEYLGYSETQGGAYDINISFPLTSPSYGDSIDSGQIPSGFYGFKYKSNLDPANPLYAEVAIEIAIKQGAYDIGVDVVIDLCATDEIRNISVDMNLYAEAAINGLTYSIAGAGTSSPAYAANDAGTVFDDTYDPSLEPSYPVTRVFTVTATPESIAGTTEAGCASCLVQDITVTYNVVGVFDPGTPENIAACT